MCELFINDFVEKVVNKLTIYKVTIRGDYLNMYYLRCLNKEVLDEIHKKLFHQICYHWKYFTRRNGGCFYFDENKEIQFWGYRGTELKDGKPNRIL